MYSVHECVVFLVSCVLVLVVSPEKGSNLLPKCRVFFEKIIFLSMLLIFIMYNHTIHNKRVNKEFKERFKILLSEEFYEL